MTEAGADVAVVVAYGRILIPALLEAPRHGCINVHASLLPKYRGAAPLNWAIVQGETESGVTTMQMAEGLDTGDVLLESRTPIGPNETTGDLHDRLAAMGAELAVETLAKLSEIAPQPQDHSAHTLAPMIDKSMAEIDWSQDAATIHNLVRGFNPWPIAWTTMGGERMKVKRTRVVKGDGPPGTVIEAGKCLKVAAGSGALELEQVQLPGKRAQQGLDLVNSGRIAEGTILGLET
jgi:methionyl-tRNA formyltransferase